MPDTSLTSQLYRRFEARAVARILNEQALNHGRRIAHLDRGTVVVDEQNLRAALYEAYIETSKELKAMIRFDNRSRPA
jgi:hypothetical protein